MSYYFVMQTHRSNGADFDPKISIDCRWVLGSFNFKMIDMPLSIAGFLSV